MIARGWTMVQSLILIGVALFSLILAVGGLAQLARWFTVIQQLNIPWAASLGFSEFLNATSSLPSPGVINALSKFPLWGFKDATMTALIVMALLLAFHIWKGFHFLADIRIIRETIKEIDARLEVLQHSADDER